MVPTGLKSLIDYMDTYWSIKGGYHHLCLWYEGVSGVSLIFTSMYFLVLTELTNTDSEIKIEKWNFGKRMHAFNIPLIKKHKYLNKRN